MERQVFDKAKDKYQQNKLGIATQKDQQLLAESKEDFDIDYLLQEMQVEENVTVTSRSPNRKGIPLNNESYNIYRQLSKTSRQLTFKEKNNGKHI